jgi:hypothetical protein
MKKLTLAAALLCVVSAATSAHAEQGISPSKLAQLGLSSMQSVSDQEGSLVRGEGRMFVSGAAISVAGPSSTTFNYGAGARGANLVGLGVSQTFAEYSVVSNNFIRSLNASTFGRSIAWAP